MPDRELKHCLEEIEDAISAIRFYTKGVTQEQLLADRKARDAIALNLLVIGRGVQQIPREMTGRYPGVPWNDLAGLRDTAATGSFRVHPAVVWETIQRELGPLLAAVQGMLMEK